MSTLLLLIPLAFAGGKDTRDAEVIRLYEEMMRLAQRTAWGGVDRQYGKLEDLKNVEVPAKAHLLGARAAQSAGDINDARTRAQRAIEASGTDIELLTEASQFLTEFDVLNGPIRLTVPRSLETVPSVRVAAGPTSPSQARALKRINDTLNAERAFRGYLPMGRYAFGGTPFEILPGADEIKVVGSQAPEVPADAQPQAVDDARIVSVAVRGAGWPADRWPELSGLVSEALRGVDGVKLVDPFAPDGGWVVVEFDPAALEERGIDGGGLLGGLGEGWNASSMTTFCLTADNDIDVDALRTKQISGTPLGEIASIERTLSAPCPVPFSDHAPAPYRFEVKVAPGQEQALLEAANAVPDAGSLGLKVEELGAL